LQGQGGALSLFFGGEENYYSGIFVARQLIADIV